MALIDEIRAKCSSDLLATRDTQAIADAVNVERVKASPIEVGNGTILEVLGLDAGNALLDVIHSQADFRHVVPLVEQGRLIVSSPLVIQTINSMVPAVLTQAQADALIAVGTAPDPVSELDVRRACYADNGDWLA